MSRPEYNGAQITDVRRGKGARSVYVYAELRASDGSLLVSATLDYITTVLRERLTATEFQPFREQIHTIYMKGI